MKKFIITDLAKGNANISADQVLEIGGGGGGTTGVNNSYSTTETLTGGTYLGKPIYRIVLKVPLSNAGEDSYGSGATPPQLETIVKEHLFFAGAEGLAPAVHFKDEYADLSIRVDLHTEEFSVYVTGNYVNKEVDVWFEYTKTTDVAP